MMVTEGKAPGLPRLCLATSYTTDFHDIGSYCAISLHLYAARWGCGVHVDTNLTLDRPPAWHRVKLIPALFDRGYEFVLWVDADAMFVDFDTNILSVVRPDKDLYLVEHYNPGFSQTKVPNTGVMLVRNTAWTRELFGRIWNMTEYVDHTWWENAAMIHLLGYRNLLNEGNFEPNAEMLRHVEFLPESYNYLPTISQHGDPIILHYAGTPNAQRRLEMPKWISHACRTVLSSAGHLSPNRIVQARLDAVRAELDVMRASRSWRLTAPMRALMRLLRGLSRRT